MTTSELVKELERIRIVVSREHDSPCDCPLCDAAERLTALIARLHVRIVAAEQEVE